MVEIKIPQGQCFGSYQGFSGPLLLKSSSLTDKSGDEMYVSAFVPRPDCTVVGRPV